MNRLALKMAEMKKRRETALITFLTAGDPDTAATGLLMKALAENGSDVIELGMPYSDPLADGPVLQAAAQRALAGGMTPDGVFALAERFSKEHDTPLALLVYCNMVFRRGVERFCLDAAKAGVSALVVPDLPLEEAGELEECAKRQGLCNIRFLSPTTSAERMEKICRNAEGFIYCVAVTGVTGGRDGMDEVMVETLQKARKQTNLPLALGFGIAEPAQAARAAAVADAVIVGSALVARMQATSRLEEKVEVAATFTRSLKEAIGGASRGI